MDTWTTSVIASRPRRITLAALELRFGLSGADPANIGQRALDAGLLLVVGDGAPAPHSDLWAQAHWNGEDAHAITSEDYQRYCAAFNRAP